MYRLYARAGWGSVLVESQLAWYGLKYQLEAMIDIGLDSPQVSLLMRRPGTKGRSAVERVIRVVAANERVKVTQSAVMRAPSLEAEVNALRAEEEQEEAMAAYHHHLKPPKSL